MVGIQHISNHVGISVIDSIIQLINNSDGLLNELLYFMNEHYSTDPVVLSECLTNQSKRKIKIHNKIYNDVSYFEYFNDDDDIYEAIIGAYIVISRVKRKHDSNRSMILDKLISHIIFLSNRERFTSYYKEMEDEDYPQRSLSSQYMIYVEYIDSLVKDCENVIVDRYTFLYPNLIQNIFPVIESPPVYTLTYQYRWKSFVKYLNDENDVIFKSDSLGSYFNIKYLMTNRIQYIKDIFKCAITIYDDYICTDMILRVVRKGEKTMRDSFAFYNVLENTLRDEDTVRFVPIHKLCPDNDENACYYIPEMIHYQSINKFKALAALSGFVLDASNNDSLLTRFDTNHSKYLIEKIFSNRHIAKHH